MLQYMSLLETICKNYSLAVHNLVETVSLSGAIILVLMPTISVKGAGMDNLRSDKGNRALSKLKKKQYIIS